MSDTPAYVSANTKYYTASNASGEMAHVARLFAENKNVIPHPQNICWFDDNLYQKFQHLLAKAEAAKGKKFQRNSNLFLDTVVVLSRERVDELRSQPNFQANMQSAIQRFDQLFQERFGFTPIGTGFHGDEGHINALTKEFLRNYHFHVLSLNFDFKTNKQPLRNMQKSDWSIVQDLVAEAFSGLGFVRGEKKEITHRNHLSKNDFVERALSVKQHNLLEMTKLEEEQSSRISSNFEQIRSQLNCIEENNFSYNDLAKKIDLAKKELIQIESDLADYSGKIVSLISETIHSLVLISTMPSIERVDAIEKLFFSFCSKKNKGVDFLHAAKIFSDSLRILNETDAGSVLAQIDGYSSLSRSASYIVELTKERHSNGISKK